MNKTRRMLVAGLGAMIPAFIAMDQGQARSIEAAAIAPVQSAAPAIALDQEALKRALLAVSPAEKLRIAGDRIRLAKSLTQSKVRSTRKVPNLMPCHYSEQPWRRQAPQRAR